MNTLTRRLLFGMAVSFPLVVGFTIYGQFASLDTGNRPISVDPYLPDDPAFCSVHGDLLVEADQPFVPPSIDNLYCPTCNCLGNDYLLSLQEAPRIPRPTYDTPER